MHGFRLSWSLLGLLTLLLEAMAAPNITSPQTVEVDMVFPRNETYGLSTLMPVVFAIQNPDLAPLLGLSLSYTIFDARTWNNTASAILDINWANASSDPYFVFDGMQKFSDVEGIWKFLWEVHTYNCSGSPQA
ncbi:hypothetical protein PHISP_05637 [Aspergillus sp. HF37]|nr:hypothetical protein PHISP_05637 [Aspergillus sp. HF37]